MTKVKNSKQYDLKAKKVFGHLDLDIVWDLVFRY